MWQRLQFRSSSSALLLGLLPELNLGDVARPGTSRASGATYAFARTGPCCCPRSEGAQNAEQAEVRKARHRTSIRSWLTVTKHFRLGQFEFVLVPPLSTSTRGRRIAVPNESREFITSR